VSRSGHVAKPQQPAVRVIVANFPMPAGTRFDWHRHGKHQLAWAPSGVLTVETDLATFILPPSRALWIPAGLRHETRSAGSATMRALYINPRQSKIHWKSATPVAVSPLLAMLIAYLDEITLRGARRIHAEALLVDLLSPVRMASIDVRLPVAAIARTVATELLKEPAEGSTLAEWGRRVGASERTLARSFAAETGLSFGRWRTLVRLQAALSNLAAGAKVSTVARRVGYETPSAFVAAFRRETGVTPADYFRGGAPRAKGR
jgi:AraC-like DNA-binding protein/quercetin dioxygenase-like cupin family protein